MTCLVWQVTFNNSRLQYYSQQDWVRCQNFAQKVLFTLQSLGIGTNLRNPDPTTLQLYGNYTADANITDTLTNDTGGSHFVDSPIQNHQLSGGGGGAIVRR